MIGVGAGVTVVLLARAGRPSNGYLSTREARMGRELQRLEHGYSSLSWFLCAGLQIGPTSAP